MNEKEFEAMNKEFITKEIEIIMGKNALEEDVLIFEGRKYRIEEMNYADGNLDTLKITPLMTEKEFTSWLGFKRSKYKGKIKGIK